MYEPTWSQPLVDWQPNASFRQAATPPVDGPADGELVQLPCINVEWLPLVLGSLDQLRNPSTWLDTLSDPALSLVIERSDQLRAMVGAAVNVPCCNVEMRLTSGCVLQFSTDGGSTWNDVTDWAANFDACVKAHVPPQIPVPAVPGSPSQSGCAIAEWLTEQLWIVAGQKLHDALNAGQRVDQFINDLVTQIAAFAPILDVIVGPFQAEYTTQLPQPLANLQTALSDVSFEAEVRCAIYSAISSTGYVNFSNFSTVAANIAAISYTYSYIPAMIANLWTALGLPAIQALQAVNPITAADCSSCGGTWCYFFDFTLNNQGWQTFGGHGNYVAGVGWKSTLDSSPYHTLALYYDMGIVRTITEMQWNYNSQNGQTSGQAHEMGMWSSPPPSFSWACFHTTPFGVSYPGYTWESVSPLCSARYPALYYTMATTTPGQEIICSGVQLRGTGANPFGVDNCVVGP